MNAADAKQRESKVLLHTYDRIPLLLDHGKGVYLYDVDGRKYLDFVSGIGVNALGYGDPGRREDDRETSAKLIHYLESLLSPVHGGARGAPHENLRT